MSEYMHLLDGKPAFFCGYQVCFATFYGKAAPLEKDLRTIRRQQQASIRNRKADGLSEHGYKMSYVRVSPTAERAPAETPE